MTHSISLRVCFMNLYRQRLFGVALTTIGFVMAALAGLALASQVNSLGTGGLFAGAGLAFAVVLPFLGAGIFFYARGSREPEETESTLPQQVRLSDLMNTRQTAALDALATELNVSAQDVLNMVHELAQLRLFSGYLTPEAQLHRIEPVVIQQMNRCQRCGNPLVLDSAISLCPSCGTEYYPG
jgi:hypothetical protein